MWHHKSYKWPFVSSEPSELTHLDLKLPCTNPSKLGEVEAFQRISGLVFPSPHNRFQRV